MSVCAACAAPPGVVGQHKEVGAGEEEQRENRDRRQSHGVVVFPSNNFDAVDDDGNGEDDGHPAVSLTNPFVPVQWDLLTIFERQAATIWVGRLQIALRTRRLVAANR